jgi:hypothetical protein
MRTHLARSMKDWGEVCQALAEVVLHMREGHKNLRHSERAEWAGNPGVGVSCMALASMS